METELANQGRNNMATHSRWRKMTVEEYFQLDRDPTTRYEYIEGYAVAMSGGSVAHEWIAKNLIREMDRHLQSNPCQSHTSDMKLFIPATGSYFLPDVTVSCDEYDNRMDTQAIRSPRLVVEVLSPSTEADDRGYKFYYYRTLPSLQEYVLVSSRYQFVEIFRRQSDETWSYQAYRPGQAVKFESLEIELTFAEMYARVTIPVKPEIIKTEIAK